MKPEQYKSFYTQESEVYHNTRYGGIYGRIFKTLHHEVICECLDKSSVKSRLLEVACGTGHTSELLVDKGFQPISCDLTKAMIDKARGRFARVGESGSRKPPQFLEANAMQLPFADNTFDILVSTRFLHLFEFSTQQQVIKEMQRVLKPGGRLIVDFDNWSSRWILAIPFLIYNLARYQRLAPFSIYNRIGKTLSAIEQIGFTIEQTYGVGGTHLVLPGMMSHAMAVKMGRWHRTRPLTLFAEQFLVSAVKKTS